MTRSIRHASFAAAFTLAIAACSAPPPPRPDAAAKLAPTPFPVSSIRKAGAGDDSVVQVAPLRDAAVDGWLKQARDAEGRNDWKAAVAATQKALALAPDAPDILQELAEREVAVMNYPRAEELAMKSFQLGPQIGALCAKNWQTLVVTRTAMNDAVERDKAMAKVKACRKSGPMRG